jgi:hypothetical protein
LFAFQGIPEGCTEISRWSGDAEGVAATTGNEAKKENASRRDAKKRLILCIPPGCELFWGHQPVVAAMPAAFA